MKYDENGYLMPMSDREVAKGIKKWLVILILTITAVSLAGWQIGWWFAKENTDRQVEIDNHNKGTQQAWRDEVVKTTADYELVDPANTAARGALRNKACDIIPRLTNTYLDENIVNFRTKECK